MVPQAGVGKSAGRGTFRRITSGNYNREDAFEELAHIAAELNQRQENIGARRLHTILSSRAVAKKGH